MSRFVAAGITTLLLAFTACGESGRGGPPAHFTPGPVPAELTTGERLFTGKCAQCHGALAVGTAQGPPLVHVYYKPSHHADIAFQRAVALGVVQHHWSFGPMPKIGGVTEADVAEIIAYVRWLQRAAGID